MILAIFILQFFALQNVIGQVTCPVNQILSGYATNVGIQCSPNPPPKKLTIGGNTAAGCGDVAIELQYDGAWGSYFGHLALTTPANYNSYSSILSSPTTKGDLILSADGGRDLVLTTKDNDGCIKFTTTYNSTEGERVRINNLGHVGISNTDPKDALHIGAKLNFHVGANYDFIGYNEYVDASNNRLRILSGYAHSITFNNGNVMELGVTKSDAANSQTVYTEANSGFKGIKIANNTNDLGIMSIGCSPDVNSRLTIRGFSSGSDYSALNIQNTSNATLFFVRNDGKIGIGTATPEQALNVIGNVQVGSDYFQPALPQGCSYRLSVDGQVVAKDIRVVLDDWSDYVFNKDYQMPSLDDVEAYINENKHLPGIPTEKEIKKKGVNIGEMQAKLLQKIEELTIYVIELKNQNIEQKNEIENLKIQITKSK